jgi:hypothetical protein
MSAPKAKPLRLAAIRICSYRGIPHPIEIKLAAPGGHGRSLVLYGENGSGKSSVGKAVRDLLDLRPAASVFDDFKYRYQDPPHVDRGVTLVFDDSSEASLIWTPAARDVSHKHFRDMARARGWLDYRAVWRASEVQYGDSVEIFRPLVQEILTGCQRGASNETFGQAWDRILELAAKNPRQTSRERLILRQLKDAIKQFNESLQGFLPELQQHANSLLAEFVPWTKMELVWGTASRYDSSRRRNKFSSGSIRLKMRYRDGDPLTSPSEVLNEARLTAIGLCLYLAGMSRSIPPRRSDGTSYPRLLVLDDVLLSLDMTHRLPLLRVLREHFTDWQVLLLTHDRAWYEIARQQLDGWSHHELFTVRAGDYEQPILREDQDHLYWALQFLQQGHVKAAAVHVRTKFEEVLKIACVGLGVKVPFALNPRTVTANDLWSSLLAHDIAHLPSPKVFTKDGVTYMLRARPRSGRVISVDLQRRVAHALSWVLNPLSHSETVERYRAEIEDAIFAVDDLDRAIHDVMVQQEILLQSERSTLLGLLKQHEPAHGTSSSAESKPLTEHSNETE